MLCSTHSSGLQVINVGVQYYAYACMMAMASLTQMVVSSLSSIIIMKSDYVQWLSVYSSSASYSAVYACIATGLSMASHFWLAKDG